MFTKHSLTREKLMSLTEIFRCQFQGGRAASARQRREGVGDKVQMKEANMIKEDDMILPHLTFSPEELDRRYPPLVAPDAVDTEDLTKDDEDELILEGNRIVKDLVSACALQDDGDTLLITKLRVVQSAQWLGPRGFDWLYCGARNDLTWLKPSARD